MNALLIRSSSGPDKYRSPNHKCYFWMATTTVFPGNENTCDLISDQFTNTANTAVLCCLYSLLVDMPSLNRKSVKIKMSFSPIQLRKPLDSIKKPRDPTKFNLSFNKFGEGSLVSACICMEVGKWKGWIFYVFHVPKEFTVEYRERHAWPVLLTLHLTSGSGTPSCWIPGVQQRARTNKPRETGAFVQV